jgi:hypothetical protein
VGCALGAAWTDTPFVVVYANQHAVLPVETVAFGHTFTGVEVSGHAAQAVVGPAVATWDRYSANSAGGTNTVHHLDVGSYQVTFPRVGRTPDHVQVTPYGEPTTRCALDGWTSPTAAPGGDAAVSLRCVNPQGQPVDSYASVAYVSTASR